ncbi:MAG TPA: SDR family NAD(P)-dependent oxidoreductase [Candidatus Acidoferrales bacterium]|nr:SDR family NAD(P)-dependent oxidoreductase [Candidatus Acidoferrales bacterium]
MGRLSGKTALITGGGAGIGRACALAFAREGARVAVLGRRRQPLEAVSGEIAAQGGEALAVVADVTRSAEVAAAIEQVVARFGPFPVLVNNAGVTFVGTAEETSEEDWNRVLAINLTGVFLVSKAALPALRQAGSGSIVNLSSVYGLVARRQRAAYAASKGGVTLLTQAMALDHAAEGIRVNCICPALVETEMVRRVLNHTPDPQATLRARIAELPLGRLGTPDDVARMAVYLASDESGWVTGAALPIDGGLTAG